jgi:hypothetical protein
MLNLLLQNSMALEDDFVAHTLREWWPEVKDRLQRAIVNKNLILTDGLLNSLEGEVFEATGDVVAGLKASFKEHGRHLDMKASNYKKRPPVEVMEEFVRKKGLQSFKSIPGVRDGQKLPTEDEQIRRLAWAISSSRLKAGIVPSNKKWYSRNFNSMVYVLIDRLTNNYAEYASQQITEGFKS